MVDEEKSFAADTAIRILLLKNCVVLEISSAVDGKAADVERTIYISPDVALALGENLIDASKRIAH